MKTKNVTLCLIVFTSPTLALSAKCLNQVTSLLAYEGSSAQSVAFAKTRSQPYLLKGAPDESLAFLRRGAVLEGEFTSKSVEVDADHLDLIPTGKFKVFGNKNYRELTNSTALKTVDPTTGLEREFILSRGVRDYHTIVNLKDGSISPQGYVSDVLLFERVPNAPYKFVRSILESRPELEGEKKFLFEDPRISMLYDKGGSPSYFLSGTDYSSHVAGSSNPDILNVYTQLEIDGNGVPMAIKVNQTTGKPTAGFMQLSPRPKKIGNSWSFVDAKNATIAQNSSGEIVVRTRLRPDFNDPHIRTLAGTETWKYAEQVFIFRNYEDLKKYDWDNALPDLFKKPVTQRTGSSPVKVKTLLKDSDLVEMYKDPNVVKAKGKGMGGGTIPIRVRREGDHIYISDGHNAKESLVGIVSPNESLPIQDGEIKHLTFDHEIRYFKDIRGNRHFIKRHYSTSIKLFNDRLDTIDGYFADAIQPKTAHELGTNSGIADLQHVYPMGRVIAKKQNGVGVVVHVYAGASDAHTTLYEFDILKLLKEMAPLSPRRTSGQVSKIN